MKVKLRTLAAGPDGITQPDSILNVSDATGKHLVATGHAVEVDEPKETAAEAPKRERAVAGRRSVEKADAPQA